MNIITAYIHNSWDRNSVLCWHRASRTYEHISSSLIPYVEASFTGNKFIFRTIEGSNSPRTTCGSSDTKENSFQIQFSKCISSFLETSRYVNSNIFPKMYKFLYNCVSISDRSCDLHHYMRTYSIDYCKLNW